MHEEVKEALLNGVAKLFRRPPKTSVTEWCEANLQLGTIQTDTPGQYSTRLTPYVRDVLEDFKNPSIESETLCFGAQTAKTMTMMAGLAWSLVNKPQPAMWVMPNKDLAGSFSETRLQPLFMDCEQLMELKHHDRHKWKRMSMEFIGSVFALIGSNSPANLASRPVGILIMDETDKFAESSDKEANALELAEMRTKTFSSPKILKTSTPSTPEGAIWRNFLEGTMHRYFLPCPECDGEIVLSLNPSKSAMPKLGCEAALKWDKKARGPNGWDYDKVEKSAHYECPHCKGKIWDRSKTKMLRNGVWRQTNPYADPRQVSRHLPSSYAPWRKSSWGRLAVEFLKAMESLEGLKGFINGTLAEPDMAQFEGGDNGRKEAVITELTPLVKTYRILTADKQVDHLWWIVIEFIPGGHSRLVAWGKCDTEDDLETIRAEHKVSPDLTCVDSGYEATTVYQECARFGWFAIRGDDAESWVTHDKENKKSFELPYRVRIFDPYIGTKNQGKKKIAELRWSNPSIKDILHRLRNSDTSPVRWEILENLATDEYWRHLDGEFKDKVFNPRTGKIKHMWVKRSRHWPNHLLDCECMALAVAMKVGILKTKEIK